MVKIFLLGWANIMVEENEDQLLHLASIKKTFNCIHDSFEVEVHVNVCSMNLA
jgi:hypothetical protein